MTVIIRPIRAEDAEAYLAMLLQIDAETKFMMFEPDERPRSITEYRTRIEDALTSDNGMIFVAEDAERPAEICLVGYLSARGGPYRRNHHAVHIVIGMLEGYTGQGIGRRLFEAVEAWARAWGAHRLELTVMCHNTRALALYQKMGFTIEGKLLHAMQVDGSYVDEYAMSKLLE